MWGVQGRYNALAGLIRPLMAIKGLCHIEALKKVMFSCFWTILKACEGLLKGGLGYIKAKALVMLACSGA